MFSRLLSMRLSPALTLACGIAVLCLLSSGVASAQPQNKKTTVTFSAPFEVPGVGAQVLPAGTYVFRLMDSLTDRHIVQILSRDETHLYSTIIAIPNYRLKATDKTVMTFAERTAGTPQAIRAWFYPGDLMGQEFVYPKSRALALAAMTHQPVLSIPDEAAPNFVAPVKTATDPPVVALKQFPVNAVTPTGEVVAMTAVVSASPVVAPMPTTTSKPTPDTMRASTPARLPETAGSLPLLALAGLLCLGVGISLRALCAR